MGNDLKWTSLGDEGTFVLDTPLLCGDEPEPLRVETREELTARQHRDAQQRAYDRSPQGRREAALRSAAESGGGRVTVVGGGVEDEFDSAFAGHGRGPF